MKAPRFLSSALIFALFTLFIPAGVVPVSASDSLWTWQSPLPTGHDLYGVWGTGSNVTAVGGYGTIVRYDGSDWSSMNSGTNQSLFGVWGNAGNSVFAVGSSGTTLRFNGATWWIMPSGTNRYLSAVWGTAGNNVFAVGEAGTILNHTGQSLVYLPVVLKN